MHQLHSGFAAFHLYKWMIDRLCSEGKEAKATKSVLLVQTASLGVQGGIGNVLSCFVSFVGCARNCNVLLGSRCMYASSRNMFPRVAPARPKINNTLASEDVHVHGHVCREWL